MKNSKSVKVDLTGGYSQDLIDLVVARAVDSKEWRKLLTKVESAGDIEGAVALKDVGQNIWHVVADKVASVAGIAVALKTPITAHLMVELTEKAKALYGEFDTLESALFEGGAQAEVDACAVAKLAAKEAFFVVESLTDFRLLCGVVSAGIKAAQKKAEALASSTWCLAEKGNMAKNAREAIVAMLKRDLNKYGLYVDWKKLEVTSVPVKEKTVDTDAQKAAKSIASAFKHSPDGAIDAILALEPTTRATIKNAIERAEKAAQIATATEDKEHKEGAVESLETHVDGMPTDLASVGTASREALDAAQHLDDLKAQGVTLEQESDMEAAASRGRRVAGL